MSGKFIEQHFNMNKRRQKLGAPPGSVVFTGNFSDAEVAIHYFQYDQQKAERLSFQHQNDHVFPVDSDAVNWYDIKGIHDTKLIKEIGARFNIHPLVLEDITDIRQRPKFDEYEEGLFFIIKALQFESEAFTIHKEHIGIYMTENLVLTFQETENCHFALIKERIIKGLGRIRRKQADYLAYALIDVVIKAIARK